MKFFVNSISSYSTRANLVNLSFFGIPDLPENVYSFNMYVPKSVELKEGEVNDLPHWVTANIWEGQWQYIIKDLCKQGKATVHKRAEKALMPDKVVNWVMAAKELNVEQPIPEHGEYFGNVGDSQEICFTSATCIKSWTSSYSGIWTQKASYNGSYYWTHPTVSKSLWKLLDANGRVFILRCSNDYVNTQLSDTPDHFTMKVKIIGHNIYRGEKQTIIEVRKQDLKGANPASIAFNEFLEKR